MDLSKYINDYSFMKNERPLVRAKCHATVFTMYIEFYSLALACPYLCAGLSNIFILLLNRDKLVFKAVIFQNSLSMFDKS